MSYLCKKIVFFNCSNFLTFRIIQLFKNNSQPRLWLVHPSYKLTSLFHAAKILKELYFPLGMYTLIHRLRFANRIK